MPFQLQNTPTGTPSKLSPTYDKLDRGKLKRDIGRYGNAGVPQEKLTFWNQIDSVFSFLDSEAVVRSEMHPLDSLLAKEKVISDEGLAVPHVSSEVVGMLEKDRAPLPEVTS